MNLSDIRNYKGRGNELVSLYVSPNNSISNVQNILDQELNSIEEYDEGTRMKYSVRDTLARIKEEISDFNSIPKNGIIIFAGRVNGDTMCYVLSDELQSAVEETKYVTGSQFSTEAAEELVPVRDSQVVVVLDTRKMMIGYNRDGIVTVVDEFESQVPSKHSKGGQSQSRFERRREEHKKEFFKKCSNKIKRRLSEDDTVFIGGPDITVKEFLNKTQIDKSVNVVTTSTEYVNKVGLRSVSKMADKYDNRKEEKNTDEKIDDFMRMIKENPSLTEYGEDRVRKAVSYGAVDEIIVEKNRFEDMVDEAESKGASIIRIDGQTDTQMRFIEAFDGIAAVLNYQVTSSAP